MTELELKQIKELLKAMNDMSNSENWSESDAQDIIVWGGELYQELYDKEIKVIPMPKFPPNRLLSEGAWKMTDEPVK